MHTRSRTRIALAILLTATVGIGCQKKGTPPAPPLKSSALPIHAGSHVFTFDYQLVTQFLIIKSDPVTGDRWTARLARATPKSANWEIMTDDGAHGLLDRRADGNFVLHLLDTFRSLQAAETEVPGPLESLGLAPPRYAFQWQSEGQDFEIRIGALPSQGGQKGGQAYAWVPGQSAFIVEGATLQMLEYMKDFASLRLKTWAGLNSNDVDEIDLLNHGKSVFYAQRDGAEWTNHAHKPVRGDVNAWLDRLTHSRVLHFVDDETQARELNSLIQKQPEREAVLADRQGNKVKLVLNHVKTQLIGLSSARPQGVFELYPETFRTFEPPRK